MVSKAKIDKTIQLAQIRNEDYWKYCEKYHPDNTLISNPFSHEHKDTYEYQMYLESEKILDNYLNSLEYEEIKDLQTLMYVGRGDAESDKEETGMQKFTALRKYFDRRGWHDDKSIEVNQMTEKMPLDRYLIDGKKILNL